MTLAAGALAFASTGQAAAAPRPSGPPPEMGVVSVLGHKNIVPKRLADEINSKDWSRLTLAQLAQAGIYPGMGSGGRVMSKKEAEGSGDVSVLSAKKCKGTKNKNQVCLTITGKKLKVTEMSTRWYAKYTRYSIASFWKGSNIIHTSQTIHGSGWLGYYWGKDQKFKDGTTICTTWQEISYKPCAKIHD